MEVKTILSLMIALLFHLVNAQDDESCNFYDIDYFPADDVGKEEPNECHHQKLPGNSILTRVQYSVANVKLCCHNPKAYLFVDSCEVRFLLEHGASYVPVNNSDRAFIHVWNNLPWLDFASPIGSRAKYFGRNLLFNENVLGASF